MLLLEQSCVRGVSRQDVDERLRWEQGNRGDDAMLQGMRENREREKRILTSMDLTSPAIFPTRLSCLSLDCKSKLLPAVS